MICSYITIHSCDHLRGRPDADGSVPSHIGGSLASSQLRGVFAPKGDGCPPPVWCSARMIAWRRRRRVGLHEGRARGSRVVVSSRRHIHAYGAANDDALAHERWCVDDARAVWGPSVRANPGFMRRPDYEVCAHTVHPFRARERFRSPLLRQEIFACALRFPTGPGERRHLWRCATQFHRDGSFFLVSLKRFPSRCAQALPLVSRSCRCPSCSTICAPRCYPKSMLPSTPPTTLRWRRRARVDDGIEVEHTASIASADRVVTMILRMPSRKRCVPSARTVAAETRAPSSGAETYRSFDEGLSRIVAGSTVRILCTRRCARRAKRFPVECRAFSKDARPAVPEKCCGRK